MEGLLHLMQSMVNNKIALDAIFVDRRFFRPLQPRRGLARGTGTERQRLAEPERQPEEKKGGASSAPSLKT